VPALAESILRRRRRTIVRGSWHAQIAARYRYAGPMLSRYAASKAKRDPLVAALPALLGDARDVLVAGCGYGIMTARLAMADPGRVVRGFDLDERKVAVGSRATEDLDNATFTVADVTSADLGKPDAAVVADVLHYAPHAGQEALLRSIVRALPEGSGVVFRDGCLGARGHRLVHAGETFARRIGFTRARRGFCFRTRDGWRSLVTSVGLVIVSERPDLGVLSNLVLVCRKGNARKE
jgi:SAM-dependent methyltransferase